MKKIYLFMSAAAVTLMLASPSFAQRKNTTSHEVAKIESEVAHPKHDIKMGKYHNKKTHEDIQDINEDYQKALRKIDKSSFSDEQKSLLKKQAAQSKELALKQLQERSQMAEQHQKAREALNMQDAMHSKANRKAVKKIHDIAD